MSELHSAEYLHTDTRDFWWNADFLALMAQRWRLGEVHRALDVGAGVGHWGQLLLPHLAPDARLFGIEREPRWVEEARQRAQARGLGERADYQQGVAEALPFPDAHFDLVTCQTVLMHVRAPLVVLLEMKRVLKPGGLLAVAEPVNMASALMLGSTRLAEPLEERLALVEFELRCYRGKAALGEGDNSLGAALPQLFTEAGLTQLAAWQADKAALLVPPYASVEAQAAVREARDWAARDFWAWSREETLRYFEAGGGDAAQFEAGFQRMLGAQRAVAEGLARGTEYSVGSGVFFLVSGRR